jgi:hypothetical protein
MLVLTWVTALVVAFGAGSSGACTMQDPCRPNLIVWVALSGGVLAPVLLIWRPVAGCAAVASVATVEILADPDPLFDQPLAFAVAGVVCVLIGSWLVLARRHQRRVAAEAGDGVRRTVPIPARDARAHTRHVEGHGYAWSPDYSGVAPVLLVLLTLCGIALFAWYGHEQIVWNAHLSRAVRTVATITGHVDGYEELYLRVALPDGRSMSASVAPWTMEQYPDGGKVPVLVDLSNPDWVELVAEPGDPASWLTAALIPIGIATMIFVASRTRRRALLRLRSAPQPAFAVLVGSGEEGRAEIFPVGAMSGPPIAWFQRVAGGPYAAALPDHGAPNDAAREESFGATWRGDRGAPDAELTGEDATRRVPAVLVGDLSDGGWAAVVKDTETLIPRSRLRLVPTGARAGRAATSGPDRVEPAADAAEAVVRVGTLTGNPEDHRPAGRPVAANVLVGMPELPLTLRCSPARRAVAALMIVAGLIGIVPALLSAGSLSDSDLLEIADILVLSSGLILVSVGTGWWARRATLAADELVVVTASARHRVPWVQVHGARVNAGTLSLAWTGSVTASARRAESRTVVDLRSLQVPSTVAGETAQDRITQVAAAVTTLRERALAEEPSGPLPLFRGRRGLGWLLLGLLALEVIVFWLLGGPIALPSESYYYK